MARSSAREHDCLLLARLDRSFKARNPKRRPNRRHVSRSTTIWIEEFLAQNDPLGETLRDVAAEREPVSFGIELASLLALIDRVCGSKPSKQVKKVADVIAKQMRL